MLDALFVLCLAGNLLAYLRYCGRFSSAWLGFLLGAPLAGLAAGVSAYQGRPGIQTIAVGVWAGLQALGVVLAWAAGVFTWRDLREHLPWFRG